MTQSTAAPPPSVVQEVATSCGELDRLRGEAAIHANVLLLDRALLYEASLQRDRFTYVSSNVEQMTGFAVEQWRQAGSFSAMVSRCHADDRTAVESTLARAAREPALFRQGVELRFRWQDSFDCWRWYDSRFKAVIDNCGSDVRIIGCIRESSDTADAAKPSSEVSPPSPPEDVAPPVADILAAEGLGLTHIQSQVLELILGGLSNKEIATHLQRSIRTVEDHRRRIMRRLGAKNSVDLVRRILEVRSAKRS